MTKKKQKILTRIIENPEETFKMVEDDNTAYDEVIQDLNGLNHIYTKDPQAKKLITQKLKQLLRLLGDDDSAIE